MDLNPRDSLPAACTGASPDDLSRSPRVDEALSWAAHALGACTDRPHLEAELLLMEVRGCRRVALFSHPEAQLTSPQVARYVHFVRRRASGEPLPYIAGHAEFFGLLFEVTPAVLIPRPETELLVERALPWLAHRPGRRVIDVGTGSGCISVTLAARSPHTSVIAGDISAAALAVAQGNARRHGVLSRVTLVQADLLAPYGSFDLIVSNPPYVADGAWDQLPTSVRREPRAALLAGVQGLDLIERLLQQARGRLAPGGYVLVEIGEEQANAVRALAQTAFPDATIDILPDLAGKPRVLEVSLD